MLRTTRCPYCQHDFAMALEHCPHCGRPSRFPNVAIAEYPEERQALQMRYDQAMRDASARGVGQILRELEAASTASVAVIARSFEETQMFAGGDNQGHATYYLQVEAEVRLPRGEKWDVLRRVTDAALFEGYENRVRFAALSLDGRALKNYGDCAWVLREDMIAHRASLLDENSVMFMEHHDVTVSQAHRLPPGHRAAWAERSKLCVAKLAAMISDKTTPAEFPKLLLRDGRTTEDDEFVEVHVGGPMTPRTLERVIVMKGNKRRRQAIARALEAKLNKLGVHLENLTWKH